MDEAFREQMGEGYGFEGASLVLGSPMVDGEVLQDVRVQAPLSMLNRHGLVTGATGTGKTKTLQIMAGQLSDAGVPVFVADMKGDLTGMAAPGNAKNEKIQERCKTLGWDFEPTDHPVEFLSLSGERGAQVRATVHSFGPLLLGKVLDLNETQTSVLSMVFKYCDDNDLPLLDLPDLVTTLKFLGSEKGKPVLEEYGGMAKATLGVLLRSIVTLEQEGADEFFGEPEFDVEDLLRTTDDGKGLVSVLELSDVMDKPRLFSTFMLWILAQLYGSLPEVGDQPKPKLAFFFDEAHLLFDDASEALLDQIELTARLIRSKAVGVFFVTQAPTDVSDTVLSQLGNRVQHSLRAFTAKDAEAIRKIAKTFPETEHYDIEEVMTSLGVGEALVTVLSPKGVPTPVAATMLVPPDSSMKAVEEARFGELVAAGALREKYAEDVDRESAHEMLGAKLKGAKKEAEKEEKAERKVKGRRRGTKKKSVLEHGLDFAKSSSGQRTIRNVLGTLFGKRR